jgi:uncharacterized protein
MKKMLLVAMMLSVARLAVAGSSPAPAVDARPTEASVRQLFQAMHIGTLLDSYYNQIDGMLDTSLRQALQGRQPTPQQQQIIDGMRAKFTALLKEELNWQGMEPTFIRAYRDTYTQHEVDGILAFYRSPAGEAMTAKQPELMQTVMQAMQQRVAAMAPKLRELQQETVKELKATENPPAESAAGK